MPTQLEIGLWRIRTLKALYDKLQDLSHTEACSLKISCICGLSEVRDIAYELFDEAGCSGE